MKDLFHTALDIQLYIESYSWKFCFIGGLALQRWGENRLTKDVDLTLLTGFGKEEQYIDCLLSKYLGRIDKAKEFALNYRVLLLKTENEIGIDLSLGAMPFEEQLIERSTKYEFLPGCTLRTCSAEDLIVLKGFAARPQDFVDIRSVAIRQGGNLQKNLIFERLKPLVELKEEPELLNKVRQVIDGRE